LLPDCLAHLLVTFAVASERRRYYVARRPSVTLSRCVCVRCISLGGEGNALYPVLSSIIVVRNWLFFVRINDDDDVDDYDDDDECRHTVTYQHTNTRDSGTGCGHLAT